MRTWSGTRSKGTGLCRIIRTLMRMGSAKIRMEGRELQNSIASQLLTCFVRIQLGFSFFCWPNLASYQRTISLHSGDPVPPALIKEGLVPCSPFRPTVAISIRTLKLFHTTSLRCPRLAIQNIAKTLCDLHHVSWVYFSRVLADGNLGPL